MKIIGNNQYQKSLNAALILNYLLQHGPASRIELSDKLGLQPSTITYIINRFLTIDLIRELNTTGKKRSSGRPAVSLELNPDYGQVFGIDMQAHSYNAVICDTRGTVRKQLHGEYPQSSEDFRTVLLETVGEVCTQAKTAPLLGIGISAPGIINTEEAIIEESWPHHIQSLDLKEFLAEKFSYPVLIENDANCCALHILWQKREGPAPSFLYILPRFHNTREIPSEHPAVGIGIGVVIDGKLHRGASCQAGEFRSAFLDRNDRSELSLSIDETYLVSTDGDVRRKLIGEILQNMGFAVSLLNPGFILVGGDLAGEDALFSNILDNELKSTGDFLQRTGCELRILSDVTYDAAKGAAVKLLGELYRVPQGGMEGLNRKKWAYMLANAAG